MTASEKDKYRTYYPELKKDRITNLLMSYLL